MPDIPNPDVLIPILIIAGCMLVIVVTWVFTRGKPDLAGATALAPIVGQTQVTQAQIGAWHRTHGPSVKQWIENHERVLKRVSDDGISIDLNDDLMAGHSDLAPIVDEAVARHPAPHMRSQLSALVVASRNTIASLRRSNWTNAEKEHLSYLEYRDAWLDRLRQFNDAEAQALEEQEASEQSKVPDWLSHEDTPPG